VLDGLQSSKHTGLAYCWVFGFGEMRRLGKVYI
jgi:hypothetical protein